MEIKLQNTTSTSLTFLQCVQLLFICKYLLENLAQKAYYMAAIKYLLRKDHALLFFIFIFAY